MNMQKDRVDRLALEAFDTISTGDTQTPLTNINQLLTTKEKITIGRRLLIAHAILEGKTRYEINNHIRVSPNTYAQIRKWLAAEAATYEAFRKTEKPNVAPRKTFVQPFSYEHLKRSYPAHMLVFALVEQLFKTKD